MAVFRSEANDTRTQLDARSSEPAVGQRNCHLRPHSVLERNLNVDQIADRATVKKMSLIEQKGCLLYLKCGYCSSATYIYYHHVCDMV
jgi:hypothetical protein